jgi:hypothetical protein
MIAAFESGVMIGSGSVLVQDEPCPVDGGRGMQDGVRGWSGRLPFKNLDGI